MQQWGRQAKSKIKMSKDKMFKLTHLGNTLFIESLPGTVLGSGHIRRRCGKLFTKMAVFSPFRYLWPFAVWLFAVPPIKRLCPFLPILNVGWPCDLSWPTESGGSAVGALPNPSGGPAPFHFALESLHLPCLACSVMKDTWTIHGHCSSQWPVTCQAGEWGHLKPISPQLTQ